MSETKTEAIEKLRTAFERAAELCAIEKNGIQAKGFVEAILMLPQIDAPWPPFGFGMKPAGLDSGLAIEERVVSGETSDGFHTFNELYMHRHSLFIALCAQIHRQSTREVWRSKLHSDGTMFPGGWFVMGIGKAAGEQITYHLPIAAWSDTDWLGSELPRAPEFDGHTSHDVLIRLRSCFDAPMFERVAAEMRKMKRSEKLRPRAFASLHPLDFHDEVKRLGARVQIEIAGDGAWSREFACIGCDAGEVRVYSSPDVARGLVVWGHPPEGSPAVDGG